MLPAIICGVMALYQIDKSNGTLVGRGQAIAGLVVGGVSIPMIGFMAALMLPALNAAREKARRANCLNNERQLALAYIMYAEEHNGTWATKLEDLRPQVTSDKVFRCPSARDPSEPSYELVPPPPGSTTADSNRVIIRENPANHRGVGGNVAYADGHAEWVRAQPRAPRRLTSSYPPQRALFCGHVRRQSQNPRQGRRWWQRVRFVSAREIH
jgi:prepilin-type processing-associated H-X9-DG protein